MTFAQYFVAGMIAAGLFASSFQNLAISIPIERDSGALKRLAGTPMPPLGLLRRQDRAGRRRRGACSRSLLLAVGVLFYGLDLPTDGSRWVTYALGQRARASPPARCSASRSPRSSRTAGRAPAVISPIAIVLQFISGVFFVFAELPQWMQTIAAFFPLKWMTQGMRSVFLPDDYQAQEPAGSWEHGRIALVLGLWLVVGLLVACGRSAGGTRRDG